MRHLILLAAGLALAGPGLTQTIQQPNVLHVFDGSTEFTFNAGLGGMADGEMLNRIPAKHFGFLRVALQMDYTLQDQNACTMEWYHVILRREDPQKPGQPDISTTGVLYQSSMKWTRPGSGCGAASWGFTHTFTTISSAFAIGLM